MRRAIADNVIDPTLTQIQRMKSGNANLYRSLMETMSEQRRATIDQSPWLSKQQSWQLPQTRRYRQSRAPVNAPIIQPDSALPWMVELARYPVTTGSIGIIKGFEQYVDQDGSLLTQITNWGNPWINDLGVEWFFRLSAYLTLGSPWINVSGPSAIRDYLPGTSYDDFPSTVGVWFPGASPPAQNIHLPIPGGYVLRVIAIVQPSQYRVGIAAKLVGTNQSELNQDAQFVVRTSW